MKIALTVAAMITFTVIANLLLKTGAVSGREAGGAWWEQILNWRVIAAFGSFAVAVFFYALVLRDVPLNVAQSFTAAQFVAIVLASAFVLGEPITGVRWAGMALIACGIAIVGWSQA